MRKLALPKGVTIQCPACSLKIAVVNQDVYQGQTIHASQFKPLVDNVEEGERMVCLRCGADYFFMGKFMTDLGWLPNY